MTPERWVAISIAALLALAFALMARVQDRWQRERRERDIKAGDEMFCQRPGGPLITLPVVYVKRDGTRFLYAIGLILRNVEACFTASEIIAAGPPKKRQAIPK